MGRLSKFQRQLDRICLKRSRFFYQECSRCEVWFDKEEYWKFKYRGWRHTHVVRLCRTCCPTQMDAYNLLKKDNLI